MFFGPPVSSTVPFSQRTSRTCAAISNSKSRSLISRGRSKSFARWPSSGEAVDVQDEIAKLEAKAAQALNDLYQKPDAPGRRRRWCAILTAALHRTTPWR